MTGLAPIITATIDYEDWLSRQVDVVEADLQLEHRQMANSLFAFLRATFYRWGPLWRETCPDLVKAPRVLAVGDLHVENFGTWRDKEGRLVWGVNDLDEAAPMPYAVDLIRLVTSAILAQSENRLAIDASGAATAVLEGYAEFLEAGGKPFILEESHPHLREMALRAERDPVHFWSKLATLPSAAPPKRIQRLLRKCLPGIVENIAFSHRIAGVGSLGRPRYVATGSSNGGFVAARRRRGCRQRGAGPRDDRRSMHIQCDCSSNRYVSQTPTILSKTDGSFADSARTVGELSSPSFPRSEMSV